MEEAPFAPADASWAELSARLSASARAWLDTAVQDRALLTDPLRFRVTFAQVARKLGSQLELIDRARLVLLVAALALRTPEQQVALIETIFHTGEQREQESLLRALAALAREPRVAGANFCPLAIEACRTNSVAVFTAIANDNPYPAAYFPELAFNQLVLKALFLNVPVARIVGLEARKSAELLRMVRAYASERRAAGRAVPADVDAVIALCER